MSAVISPCGLHRYRLDRNLWPVNSGGKVFAYFGINPSTADATFDDATVRKWRGFTERNGGERFIVGNVFSYRATDVHELARAQSPQGPGFWAELVQILAEADILVPCWGSRSKVPERLRPQIDGLLELLTASGKPVMHFGLTSGGDPKHPLMLAYSTPLRPWDAV